MYVRARTCQEETRAEHKRHTFPLEFPRRCGKTSAGGEARHWVPMMMLQGCPDRYRSPGPDRCSSPKESHRGELLQLPPQASTRLQGPTSAGGRWTRWTRSSGATPSKQRKTYAAAARMKGSYLTQWYLQLRPWLQTQRSCNVSPFSSCGFRMYLQ
jgi:hypothetical protein